MKNNWIRFIAGVLASVVLVGAFALTGGMKGGKRTDGLLYQASGLHPDGEILSIGGQPVTCEEYLFWLAMACQNVAASVPGEGWSAPISEGGLSYAEYAKVDAVEAVKQYAVVRLWAEQAGVTLSDSDRAAMESQRQQLIEYYGGEEGYRQQLALMGLSQEMNNSIEETQYLYRSLYQAFCTPGTDLYPDDQTLLAYAEQQGYMSAYVITLTGENAETMAADLLERWQKAEDPAGEYEAICQELQQDAGGAVTLVEVTGDALCEAVVAAEIGEIFSVIDPYGDGSCFLVLRTDTDLAAVAETYFDVLFDEKLSTAAVVTNSKLYDSLDAGAFYEKLSALRTELMASMVQEDADGHDGHDHGDGTESGEAAE